MKEWFFVFGYSMWEFWLGRTKLIVANSTWELILWGLSKIKEKVKEKWHTAK